MFDPFFRGGGGGDCDIQSYLLKGWHSCPKMKLKCYNEFQNQYHLYTVDLEIFTLVLIWYYPYYSDVCEIKSSVNYSLVNHISNNCLKMTIDAVVAEITAYQGRTDTQSSTLRSKEHLAML